MQEQKILLDKTNNLKKALKDLWEIVKIEIKNERGNPFLTRQANSEHRLYQCLTAEEKYKDLSDNIKLWHDSLSFLMVAHLRVAPTWQFDETFEPNKVVPRMASWKILHARSFVTVWHSIESELKRASAEILKNKNWVQSAKKIDEILTAIH